MLSRHRLGHSGMTSRHEPGRRGDWLRSIQSGHDLSHGIRMAALVSFVCDHALVRRARVLLVTEPVSSCSRRHPPCYAARASLLSRTGRMAGNVMCCKEKNSNKMARNWPKNNSSLFSPCYRANNREDAGYRQGRPGVGFGGLSAVLCRVAARPLLPAPSPANSPGITSSTSRGSR